MSGVARVYGVTGVVGVRSFGSTAQRCIQNGPQLVSTGYLKKHARDNQLVKRLARKPAAGSDDLINCKSTVPAFELLRPKAELEKELSRERPDLSEGVQKTCTVYYRLAKTYLKFFQFGLKSIWSTYKELRATVYSKETPYYVFDNGLGRNDMATGNAKDKKLVLTSKSLDQCISEMATAVRCGQNVKGEKMWGFSEKDEIAISRKQLQEMVRNKYDMSRLPFFGSIFLIFDELSLLIVYLSPYIIPTTCVYPYLMSRYFYRCVGAQKQLRELRNGVAQTEIAARNPFDMEAVEARALSELLMVNATMRTFTYLESDDYMRRGLLQRYKEITVDNYLILRDGGVDKMSTAELFQSCLRRGLIDFEELLSTIKQKSVYYEDFMDVEKMRGDLKKFIADFDDRRNNIGLMGLQATTN